MKNLIIKFWENLKRSFKFKTNYDNNKMNCDCCNDCDCKNVKIDSENKVFFDECVYYDNFQGRHKCTCDNIKSNKCTGVCVYFRKTL